MATIEEKLNNLMTVKQFSDQFKVTENFVRQRIKDGSLEASQLGRTWLIDASPYIGYITLQEYTNQNKLNADSMRRRLTYGWLLGKKLGAYWFVDPDHLRDIPEGYVPVKEYAKRAGIHYQVAIDNCRNGKITAEKKFKFWYVKEDEIPKQLSYEID